MKRKVPTGRDPAQELEPYLGISAQSSHLYEKQNEILKRFRHKSLSFSFCVVCLTIALLVVTNPTRREVEAGLEQKPNVSDHHDPHVPKAFIDQTSASRVSEDLNINKSAAKDKKMKSSGTCKMHEKSVWKNCEPTFAASFPGSGSEMFRNLIEAMTGIKTLNYEGNCRIPVMPHNYVTYKTHAPWRCEGQTMKPPLVFPRAIVLVRNPIDALPSLANFWFEMSQHDNEWSETEGHHQQQAKQSFWEKWRDENFKYELNMWRHHFEYWIDNYDSPNLLVVPFEHLVDNVTGVPHTKKIASFLNSSDRNVTTVSQENIACTWNTIIAKDGSDRMSVHRTKKYVPKFTGNQLDEIMRVLFRLASKYRDDTFGSIFMEYIVKVVDHKAVITNRKETRTEKVSKPSTSGGKM